MEPIKSTSTDIEPAPVPVMLSVRGEQYFDGCDPDNTELMTEGTMTLLPDGLLLRYEESELTGMEGTTTTFAVGSDHVVLTRTGSIESQMVFEKGKRNVSLYDMGFGALTIGVKARRLKNELGPEGGRLEISYGIEIEDQIQGLNSFVIDVRRPQSSPIN